MVAASGGHGAARMGLAHIGRGFALFLDALRLVAGLEGWHSLLRLQQTWYNLATRCVATARCSTDPLRLHSALSSDRSLLPLRAYRCSLICVAGDSGDTAAI